MSDKKQRRLQHIIELLEQRGRLETAALSSELGVTELTIRRDIEELDSQGIARRIYGGVLLNTGRSFEPAFAFRLKTNVESKQAIASQAVGLIPRGANVAMDFGTKTYFVAKEMRRRRLQILVAPTIMQVVEVLAQDSDIHVLVPGGEVKPVELSLYGSTTEAFFREHRWDVAIVSVAGVSTSTDTMTDYNEGDARVKAAMVASADRVIVLAEAHHMGTASFAPVCQIDAVDVVITDAVEDDPTVEALRKRGIDVRLG